MTVLKGMACCGDAESLRALYCTAMRFEAAFFSEQDDAPQLPRIALLGVDFDETCSRSDTIGAVIETAISAAAKHAEGGTPFFYHGVCWFSLPNCREGNAGLHLSAKVCRFLSFNDSAPLFSRLGVCAALCAEH